MCVFIPGSILKCSGLLDHKYMRFSAQLVLLLQETLKGWNLETYLMHSSILELDILLIVYFIYFCVYIYHVFFFIHFRTYIVK